MEPTSQMRFQFIASDSTRAGQYLDGGSLIEAAVDDFILYDRMIVNVEELQSASQGLLVYPNPATDRISIQSKVALLHNAQIQLLDATGRMVCNRFIGDWTSSNAITLPVSEFADGTYTLKLISDEAIQTKILVVKKD